MINIICENAVNASNLLRTFDDQKINLALELIAEYLNKYKNEIIQNNEIDCVLAEKNNISSSLLDRLKLNEERIESLIKAALDVRNFKSPIGNILEEKILKSGIKLTKISVPIGVIALVYEARPNVTVDSAVLCLKSGNVCILKGSSSALNTNRSIVGIIRRALVDSGLPVDSVQLIDDPNRNSIDNLINKVGKVDLVIPRGGSELIKYVVENAKVPVIETGAGVCHVYVDQDADYQMVEDIIVNAKTQRPAVCNSIEIILFNKNLSFEFIQKIINKLQNLGVVVKGDNKLSKDFNLSEAIDWNIEYGDLTIGCKYVDNVFEAISHISKYSTKHSDAILTNSKDNAEMFMNLVDSACVYWNASTRFSDGGEFGLGAEIGISTQKIHVRGPFAIESLISYKYKLIGSGQIRS